MPVCFNANRQSNEFPANAIIAASVRMKSRRGFTCFYLAEKVAQARKDVDDIFGRHGRLREQMLEQAA
jgi:hypothetical protein